MIPKIIFVTYSLKTRWQVYSQALVRASGLADKIIVLDGRSGWHPLNFVDKALAVESDFIVHIDEDCFLLHPDDLLRLINKMAKDQNIAVAGVPDGGSPYRFHNPLACNLYFTIFKTEILRRLVEKNPAWKALRFDNIVDENNRVFGYDHDQPNVCYDDFEPSYPVFWLILKERYKFIYLNSSMHPKFMASRVYLDSEEKPVVIHAWHLRKWFSKEMDSEIGMSPVEKYKRIAAYLNRYIIVRPVVICRWVESAVRLIVSRSVQQNVG